MRHRRVGLVSAIVQILRILPFLFSRLHERKLQKAKCKWMGEVRWVPLWLLLWWWGVCAIIVLGFGMIFFYWQRWKQTDKQANKTCFFFCFKIPFCVLPLERDYCRIFLKHNINVIKRTALDVKRFYKPNRRAEEEVPRWQHQFSVMQRSGSRSVRGPVQWHPRNIFHFIIQPRSLLSSADWECAVSPAPRDVITF